MVVTEVIMAGVTQGFIIHTIIMGIIQGIIRITVMVTAMGIIHTTGLITLIMVIITEIAEMCPTVKEDEAVFIAVPVELQIPIETVLS